jgi:sugar lactone lactonase YvrE
VADTGNGCIRRIGTDPDRTVTTFAGAMGQSGLADGPAAAARFKFPMGMALDPAGNVLVADTGNNRIRSVDRAGNVTTIAGSGPFHGDGPGARAGLMAPTAVAAAPDGRVFVVTTFDGRVKVVGTDPARTVTTIAGGGPGGLDGSGEVARFGPQGGAVWAGDRLLVADPANFRIRAVIPGANAAGTSVSTLAGTGKPGAADGAGGAASFGLPLGLALAPDGRVLVADGANGTVRAIVR